MANAGDYFLHYANVQPQTRHSGDIIVTSMGHCPYCGALVRGQAVPTTATHCPRCGEPAAATWVTGDMVTGKPYWWRAEW